MSYCRWSSNNWDCDLYCYVSLGGYVIHVAGNRITSHIPGAPDILTTDIQEWDDANRAQTEAIDNAVWQDIGLPHDGATFVEPDLKSFLDRVIYLRDLGYHVPDDVIARIQDEIAEDAKNEMPH